MCSFDSIDSEYPGDDDDEGQCERTSYCLATPTPTRVFELSDS